LGSGLSGQNCPNKAVAGKRKKDSAAAFLARAMGLQPIAGSGPLFHMKSAAGFVLVCVTAPDLKVARRLARAALEGRLIACANLLPAIESHYWWKGKIETASEVLMLMKTARSRVAALEKLILEKHPYDTPEFLVLPLRSGSARYLRWIAGEVKAR
jgi:periplasmic divalent cation tolerance protein